MSAFTDGLRKRLLHPTALLAAVFVFIGAGDDSPRFNQLGHRLMCVCGCSQILLECNHIGCHYSDGMRGELTAGLERGDSDDLTLQSFVQKYGTTVLAAPTTTGFNQVAWVVPYAVLLVAMAITIFTIRSWITSPLRASAGGAASVDNSDMDGFRAEVRKATEL